MKKIFALVLVLMMVLLLCSCGNRSVTGIGNYEFKKVHINTYHHSGCLTVEKWYENPTGIEVKTKEAGYLFLSEGTYTLVEDKCPFCWYYIGKA